MCLTQNPPLSNSGDDYGWPHDENSMSHAGMGPIATLSSSVGDLLREDATSRKTLSTDEWKPAHTPSEDRQTPHWALEGTSAPISAPGLQPAQQSASGVSQDHMPPVDAVEGHPHPLAPVFRDVHHNSHAVPLPNAFNVRAPPPAHPPNTPPPPMAFTAPFSINCADLPSIRCHHSLEIAITMLRSVVMVLTSMAQPHQAQHATAAPSSAVPSKKRAREHQSTYYDTMDDSDMDDGDDPDLGGDMNIYDDIAIYGEEDADINQQAPPCKKRNLLASTTANDASAPASLPPKPARKKRGPDYSRIKETPSEDEADNFEADETYDGENEPRRRKKNKRKTQRKTNTDDEPPKSKSKRIEISVF